MDRGLTLPMPVIALAAILAAGCMEGCGYSADEVTWTEPGLYARLDEGMQLLYGPVEWAPPQGALPFDGTVRDQPVPAGLRAVSWVVPGVAIPEAEWQLGFSLERDGVVTAIVPETADEDEVREGFVRFAGNVTTATEAERRAWAQAFLEQRILEWTSYPVGGGPQAAGVEFYRHSAKVPGPFRLDALANETAVHWTGSSAYDAMGSGESSPAGWSWTFGLATWKVPLPHGDHGAHLLVDPLDNVRFDGDFAQDVQGEEVKEQVREAMAGAGLPAPTFQSYQEGGSIC